MYSGVLFLKSDSLIFEESVNAIARGREVVGRHECRRKIMNFLRVLHTTAIELPNFA